jgi:starch synthase
MRVLLLGAGMLPIPPPGWGAVERAIHGLAGGLGALGIDVAVVNEVVGGRLGEYRFAARVGRRLKAERWDILHASTPVVANYMGLTGRDYVYTSHSRHWFGTSRATERWGLWLERRAVRRARRVIALTPAVAQRMSQGRASGKADRVRVIPNGIRVADFGPRWEARTGTELIGVGAVNRRKRWHVAAKAVSGIPGAHLTLAGPLQDPVYAEELRHLAAPARLDLVGEVSDAALRDLYARSDVFLLTSGSELMSIAVMEAMASALPVVGTAALAGLVTEGVTGFLVDEPRGEEPLVAETRERLTRLLEDGALRRKLGEQGRKRAMEEWDWSEVARRVRDLYSELRA